jgi:hypothetical protein
MCAAVEIYNKPKFDYRDETAIILLVNSWELLLKAILSKKRVRIYYPKERNQPYRTLSVRDSLTKCREYFPEEVDYAAAAENLKLLIEYRDTAVHFYHKEGLEVVLYTLAQTSVVNFRDVVLQVFDRDLAEEVSLSLLPLSFSPPVEPIEFLRDAPRDSNVSSHVREFAEKVVVAVNDLEEKGADTGRLLTVFEVNLVSTKKVEAADLVVGVQGDVPEDGKLLVQRRTDPNRSHPYREGDIISSKSDPSKSGLEIEYDGRPLGQYEFRAIGKKYEVKEHDRWCWQDETGAVTRYSHRYVEFLKSLKREDVEAAVREYRQ